MFLVASFPAIAALAGRYWSGSTADAVWNDTANWASSSGGTTGKSVPDATTSTTYFYDYYNGSCVFNMAAAVAGGVYIDTGSSSPFVWSASDPAFGLSTSHDNGLRICQDANKSPAYAYLQIDS